MVLGQPIDVGLPLGGSQQAWSVLTKASVALIQYFQLRTDSDRLARLVAEEQSRSQNSTSVEQWLRQIHDDHATLSKTSDFKGRDPSNGFMDLKEVVVLALDAAKLKWGGTYRTGKDIMHFDWRRGAIKRAD